MLMCSFWVLSLGACVLFVFGLLSTGYNLMLFGICSLWLAIILFCYQKLTRRITLLLFSGAMFLFLIGRPVIAVIRGDIWWNIASGLAVSKALLSLFISLIFLLLGTFYIEKRHLVINVTELGKNTSLFITRLQQGSMIVFYLSIVCVFLEGYEKIAFMQSHTYVEFYTSYITTQPLYVKALIQLMKPTLCVFLATMPSKRKAFPVLTLYLMSTIPSLIVGMRSPTLLACSFVFIYYYFRDLNRKSTQEKWLGVVEKSIILISIPMMVVFLFAYTYWRNGYSVNLFTNENILFSFIYQQGNSFDVLVRAFDVMDKLPENNVPGYMLGPIYDNLVHNNIIGRTIFNTIPTTVQTPETLQISHDMKAHLSYALMGKAYFQGQGVGVVYILEVLADFGWIGLAVYNFLLGVVLQKLIIWFNKNWLSSCITLYIFFQLFYTPRSNSLYMVSHLVHPYFWISIAGCYFIGRLKLNLVKIPPCKKLKIVQKKVRL